jgi:hypothetical protein
LKKARSKISLIDLGIDKITPRKAITGAMILEIFGEKANDKACRLESKLKKIFVNTGVLITRPVKKADLRIYGLDDSVSPVDIVEVIAREGACSPRDIKCSEVKELEVV